MAGVLNVLYQERSTYRLSLNIGYKGQGAVLALVANSAVGVSSTIRHHVAGRRVTFYPGRNSGRSSLEHIFIADCDTSNVVCSVGLDSLLNRIPLPCVSRPVVVWHSVVAEINLEVRLGLLDSLQLNLA